jgi:hypothetical protein
MKNLLKISVLVVATALITTSFYLNKATQLQQQNYNPSEILGKYSAVATIKYKATEIADGDVTDIVTIDTNFTVVVSKNGAFYKFVIDDNNLKTPPKELKTTAFNSNDVAIAFQIPKQQFDPDSIKPITITGIKSYKHESVLVAGKYSMRTKKLSFKFGGNFYKSLDGSAAAIVSMPTEIEFVASKK